MDTVRAQVGDLTLHVISDTHLEFHRDNGAEFLSMQDPQDADVLVLAGDICGGSQLQATLGAFAGMYPEVVFVLGNHDYYGCEDPFKVAPRARDLANLWPNVHLLDREVLVLKGQRFVGGTLWFKMEGNAVLLQTSWSDFRIPRLEVFLQRRGEGDKAALAALIRKGDIVVTHHLPTYRSVAEEWRGHRTNAYFVHEMDETIATKEPALWIHGHTHSPLDYTHFETRVLCNPFGYPL